jgi:hypothetical protein
MCRDVTRLTSIAANVYDSPSLDKKLFDNNYTASVTFGNKVYGVSLGRTDDVFGVLYNKDLLAKHAPEYDPMELYRTGQWNLDTFREVAKLCTVDTTGDGKTDVWGVGSNTDIIDMFVDSSTGGVTTMNNGRVESLYATESSINVLAFCRTFYRTDKAWRFSYYDEEIIENFTKEKTAMCVASLKYYKEIAANATFDLEFVPVPTGIDQTQYAGSIYEGRVYMIPTQKTKRLTEIGYWLNGMAKAGDGLLQNELACMEQNGLNADSRANYQWVLENAKPDYKNGISFKVDAQIDDMVLNSKRFYKSVCSLPQQDLDDYFQPFYQ